jgi:hypothetical protein
MLFKVFETLEQPVPRHIEEIGHPLRAADLARPGDQPAGHFFPVLPAPSAQGR